MLDGLYAAASGMQAQQTALDAIANDLANESTPGYQATKVGFHDLLYASGGASSGSTVATGAGAAAAIIGRSQLQGSMQQTGQPLDVAILGPGYIEVRRPDGTIGLTRNGVLQLNAQRRLTTTHRDGATAADHDPAGHLALAGEDRSERNRARRQPHAGEDLARRRPRARTSCSPTATASSARPPRAVRSAAPPARRCSRVRSRPRTSTRARKWSR